MGNKSSTSSPNQSRSHGITSNFTAVLPSSSSFANSVKTVIERGSKTGVLKLAKCGIKELPGQILELRSNLRHLDLSENKLSQLPSFIGQFPILKHLNLDSNRLTFLPDEIAELKKLEFFSAKGNCIPSIPDTFSALFSLKTLNLSSNRLTQFPVSITTLPNLEMADLSGNHIQFLPKDIGQIHCMELNLNQNQLSSLPDELAQCQHLKVLRLEENCLPKEAFSQVILKDSKISLLAVDGNLFQEKDLHHLSGYEEYMERYTATKKKMY